MNNSFLLEHFIFETCTKVPERGGRGYGAGGLVEVESKVVWGRGGGLYYLDENNKWKRWTVDVQEGAKLGVCEGSLVAVERREVVPHVRHVGRVSWVLCS